MSSNVASSSTEVTATTNTAKPRLMILKMQVENFKSYGGVKEIGPFHKCFSSVVGPNGSGKSNVIDAMLFVFGKKSSKLRLNKVSELIHKSAEYPDLEYARVTVFFQEIYDVPSTDGSDDNYTIVPGSQFTVTRTALKDNSSKYYINGKNASFTDVTNLLKSKDIDLDNNRFLILQGEVELISQMKPKAQSPHEEGLLEYLEDIIGSNTYVEQIEHASAVLEQLTEQRNEKIKRVQIAEKDKEGLEGSKVEAEGFLSKEREYCRQKGILIQKSLATTLNAIHNAETKHNETSTVLNKERETLATVSKQVEEVESRLIAAEKALGAANAEQESIQNAIRVIEHEDVKLQEQMNSAVTRHKQLKETITKEKLKVEEATKTIKQASESVPTLENNVKLLQAEKDREEKDHDAVMATLKGETEVLRKKLEAKQNELTPAADAAVAAANALATSKTELRLMKETTEAASNQLSGLRAKETQIKNDIIAQTNEKNALQKDYDTAMKRRGEADKDIAMATAAEMQATEAAKAARTRLEEGKAALASDGNRSTLVTQLMAATKKGGPLASAGLYGRLGDLGRIDDKYDVAVTTACGSLNNLIVDTTEGGQQCLEYLRAKQLGRAKFIILNKITDLTTAMNKSVTTPENVPRLFDLITPKDEKFRIAFYFALRNTVVATDMEQATRVAFGKDGSRWRVVTLNGEVIETSGSMSGGGKVAYRGGMSSTFAPSLSAEELANLEKEAAKAAAMAADAKTKKATLLKEITTLDKILPQVLQRISKLDMEISALVKMGEDIATQITTASATLAKSSGPSAADAQAMAELTKKVASLESANTMASTAALNIEKQVNELKRQIVEVGGEKIARAKARLDRASEALEKAIKDVTKAKSDLKAAEKAGEKASQAASKAEEESNQARKEYETLKAKLAPLELEAMQLVEKLTAIRVTVTQCETEKIKYRDEAEKIVREVKVIREKEMALAAILTETTQLLEAGRKRAKDLQRSLNDITADYSSRMEEYVNDVAAAMTDAGEDINETLTSTENKEGATSTGAITVNSIPPKVLANIKEPLQLPILTEKQLSEVTLETLEAALAVLKSEREELSKKANLSAIQEYREKEKDYLRRVAELEAVAKAREEARKNFENFRKERLEKFMKGFSIITLRLKEMYQMITLGGDAELELVDSLDPFSEGIVFSVRPPKKSWKNISNLSGGEKTLSSLALVFALHHYKPTPLYVMDEIDAALDFKNVSIVANYIKERTKNAQFIIISLRNNMFELADRLVGIYKTKDVTKSITINPKLVAAAATTTTSGNSTAIRSTSSSGI